MPQIKLEARPHAIALDTAKVALIVVDMQNDYGSKGGLFRGCIAEPMGDNLPRSNHEASLIAPPVV